MIVDKLNINYQMNINQQIEHVINEILSGGDNHMEAVNIYTGMIEQSPFDVTNYHFQYILQNLQNNNAVRKGFTLLYQILKKPEVYTFYTPEQNSFIQTKLLELLLTPHFDESNRSYLLDIIEIAQKNYNNAHLAENSEFGWISVFQFCINISLLDDKAISSLGIELISRFIRYGTLIVSNNVQIIHEIIQKVLMSEENFFPQIISTLNLISECFNEEISFKQYAPNVVHFIQLVQPEISKELIISIYRFKVDFFSEVFSSYINIISSLLANTQYPIDTKYCILDVFQLFFFSERQAQKFTSPEIYTPIIQSISILFTKIESDEDLSLIEQTKLLLGEISNKLESEQFDNCCLSIATDFLKKEDWKFRFSGLSIFSSILYYIEEEDLIKMTPLALKYIEDSANLCRKTVYKIIKKVSKKRQRTFASEFQQAFFSLLLESIPKESSPDIVIYSFKVLSCLCENSGSEILEQYYTQILQLCSIYSNENSIPLQVSIINCIRCLCKSMMEHLSDSYPLIKQYITNMSTIEIPIIRYSVIYAIPQVCKIISSNSEKVKMAEFGLNLFIASDFTLLYSEEQQLLLFSSFRKLIKIINFKNIEIFQHIIISLIKMASQQIELQIVSDNTDQSLIPKGMIILRSQNFDHKICLYSHEKCREVCDAFVNLTKLIEKFPELFIPVIDKLFEIIIQSTKQFSLKIFYSSNQIPDSSLSCFSMLIEKADLINVSYQQCLTVLNELIPDLITKQVINFLKNIINKFNDPGLIQPSIDIMMKFLGEIKDDIKDCNKKCNEIKNNSNSEDKMEFIKKLYIESREKENLIARFFSFLIEKFPAILNEEFITFLRSLFVDETGKVYLSFLIIETEIQILTTKQFDSILSNCGKYINEFGKECLYTLELIQKIINSTDDPQILMQTYNLVFDVLNFDLSDFDEYPYLRNKSVYLIVILFQKFPPSTNDEALNLFIELLPIDDENCKIIHRCFASFLQQKPEFFVNEENLFLTLKIIAKICKGHTIDEETRLIFKQFIQLILSQEQDNMLIQNNLNELNKCYITRLRSFANDAP